MSDQSLQGNGDDKPRLLKALELVLADPAKIRREVIALKEQYQRKSSGSNSDGGGDDEINNLVADKIISNSSYHAAFAGGVTALSGVVPGLGTVITTFGGPTADIVLSMKYQIEMTMALATVYDHNIETEEMKRLCFIIAGLGAINKAATDGTKAVGTKAFVKMVQQYLKGSTLQAVKEIFKKVGVTFTRKAVEKAIPFGVGVIIGFSVNKGLTWYVGNKAKDFFSCYDENGDTGGGPPS